jgi:hypothetical protein
VKQQLVMIKIEFQRKPLSGTIFSSVTMIACKKKGYENTKVSVSQYLPTESAAFVCLFGTL